MCMQRKDRRELLPFDPKPERTLHQLPREAHTTQSEIMQHQVNEGQIPTYYNIFNCIHVGAWRTRLGL